MKVDFYKYHGTGNDFIMIDNRRGIFPKNNTSLTKRLCERRFGIGADGLILLEDDKNSDFRMVYYNSDGNESTMCGNGGRCIAAFARKLGVVADRSEFMAIDGLHSASESATGLITLQMKDVDAVQCFPSHVFLDTGSPHHVEFVDNLRQIDLKNRGSEIRYGKLYGVAGSNVNFVLQDATDTFSVRTYERGVEDETLSCGTGAVAVAIAAHALGKTFSTSVQINVEGGQLEVGFTPNNGKYHQVYLTGPATFIFNGIIDLAQWQH